MNEWIQYFVIAVLIGYFFIAIIRIVFNRKLAKKTREYETIVQDEMTKMQKDIQSRATHLKESIQMINHEYSRLMNRMDKQHRDDANELAKKVAENKARSNQKPRGHSPVNRPAKPKPPVNNTNASE